MSPSASVSAALQSIIAAPGALAQRLHVGGADRSFSPSVTSLRRRLGRRSPVLGSGALGPELAPCACGWRSVGSAGFSASAGFAGARSSGACGGHRRRRGLRQRLAPRAASAWQPPRRRLRCLGGLGRLFCLSRLFGLGPLSSSSRFALFLFALLRSRLPSCAAPFSSALALLLLDPPGAGAAPRSPRRSCRSRAAGADRVVVAGDHVVDGRRVAVGVDQADDRDAAGAPPRGRRSPRSSGR